jgi:hypothetical protein
MLDEFSIDQQKVVAEHKEQLEKLETSYKDEARKNQEEFKVHISLVCVEIEFVYSPLKTKQFSVLHT